MKWALLAFSPVCDVVLVFANILRYFVLVFNGSDSLAVTRRDKDATWRMLSTLCRELDWSRPRLLHELPRLSYRTFPPGHMIDWRHSGALNTVNIEASTVTLNTGPVTDYGDQPQITVGIEVIPPDDAELPSPSADAPAPAATQPTTPIKTVTDRDVQQYILAIKDEQPDDPPAEDTLLVQVETHFGVRVGRDRVRSAREKVAPQWVKPVGRPRKPAQ